MNTTELKKLAEAATPGPWRITGSMTKYIEASIGNGWVQEVCSVGPTAADNGYGPQHHANANLIAAANPAAILNLLAINAELVEALKGFTEKQMTVGQRYTTEGQAMLDALAKAEGGEL